MIRYLVLEEVLELHRVVLEQSGGLPGALDLGGLESALAQPQVRGSRVVSDPGGEGSGARFLVGV